MSIQILKLRGSCHLQDAGRVGQANLGMPMGGFADRICAELANLLVGKKASAVLIECTLGTPDLLFEEDCCIAISGANVQPKLDGVAVPHWQRIHVKSGSKLTCGHARKGLRNYIAVSRTILVPRWRGSVSPVLLSEEMFPPTSVLQERDELRLGDEVGLVNSRVGRAYVQVPEHMRMLEQGDEIKLQILPAPESSLLLENEEMLRAFQKATWEVSPQSSRMGIRLVGPSLPLGKTGGFMRSAPVLPGTVQLLPDGNLIVTHVDSPTIGGYPRIGILDSYGLSVLAQAVPGRTKLRFRM